jgi:hypothetical protein
MNAQQAATQALDTIRRAYQEAATIIEAIDDPDEAFHQADQLAEGIRRVYDEQATKLRAFQVERIWTAEEMTLAELAGRISRSQPRSKQRAHQLLKAALDAREE